MRLNANDIKDLNILKHYRIIRKWACKNNNLTDAELQRKNIIFIKLQLKLNSLLKEFIK